MNDEKVLLSSAKTHEEKIYTGIRWHSSMSSAADNNSFYQRERFKPNPIGLCQIPTGWNAGVKITLGGARECVIIVESYERKSRSLILDWRVLEKWCAVEAFEVYVCDGKCQPVEFCSSKGG